MVSGNSMTFLFDGRNRSSNIVARTYMDYMGQGLGRSGVKNFDDLLARISAENPQLDTLNLGENSLTDEFVDSIIRHLISNPRLQMKELDLGGNLLTDAGATRLLAAMEERINSSLRQLLLRGNRGITVMMIQTVETKLAHNVKRFEEKSMGR